MFPVNREAVKLYLIVIEAALRCTWPVLILPSLIVLFLIVSGQGRDLVPSTEANTEAIIKFYIGFILLAASAQASCLHLLLHTSNEVGNILITNSRYFSFAPMVKQFKTSHGRDPYYFELENEWAKKLKDHKTRPRAVLKKFYSGSLPSDAAPNLRYKIAGLVTAVSFILGPSLPLWLISLDTWVWQLVAVIASLVTFAMIFWIVFCRPFDFPTIISGALPFQIVAASVLLLTAIFPVEVGEQLGSGAVACLAAAAWLVVVATLTHLSRQVPEHWSPPPLLTSVLLIWGIYLICTVHELPMPLSMSAPDMRCASGHCISGSTQRSRLSIQEAMTPWRNEVDGSGAAASDKADRSLMILVAAAGGGIRAAYWTSLVLGHLEDAIPNLHARIFAISAVSGGSLGAAAYSALVARGASPPRCRLGDEDKQSGFAACARAFMSGDFLAPTIAATLTGDIINLPFEFVAGSRVLLGRDEALELGWEAQWRNVLSNDNSPDSNEFGRSFDELWWNEDGRRTAPVLLLNGTSARTGERIVVSNLDAREFVRVDSGCAINVAEHADIRLSTAVNASARFPYVAPPGMITLDWRGKPDAENCVRSATEAPDKQAVSMEPEREASVDGGYYDNYGAATLLDLLDRLEEHFGGRGRFKDAVHLVTIQITSDPTPGFSDAFDVKGAQERDSLTKIGEDCAEARNFEAPEIPAVRATLGEPLTTLLKARMRAGTVFARELRRRTGQLDGRYFHFGLREDVEAPLGWTLSAAAREQIDNMLPDAPGAAQSDTERLKLNRCNVQKQMDDLLPLLKRSVESS